MIIGFNLVDCWFKKDAQNHSTFCDVL